VTKCSARPLGSLSAAPAPQQLVRFMALSARIQLTIAVLAAVVVIIASADHCAGSIAFSIWPALTFSNLWTTPDGHRISTNFATGSPPKPAINRLSLAERYPTAVLTVKYCANPDADTTLTRQPMPSRFDFLPMVCIPNHFLLFPPSFRST